MTGTAEVRIAKLKSDIALAQRAKADAEREHAVATGRALAAREALKFEFRVETPEQAVALLAQLEKDRDKQAELAEAWLRKAGEQ